MEVDFHHFQLLASAHLPACPACNKVCAVVTVTASDHRGARSQAVVMVAPPPLLQHFFFWWKWVISHLPFPPLRSQASKTRIFQRNCINNGNSKVAEQVQEKAQAQKGPKALSLHIRMTLGTGARHNNQNPRPMKGGESDFQSNHVIRWNCLLFNKKHEQHGPYKGKKSPWMKTDGRSTV